MKLKDKGWLSGGHNNWFDISLDGPQFQLKINWPAEHLYTDFAQAANEAAQLLNQKWGDRPIYVALSGGLDSEYAAETLRRNNIPFTPIIVKIDNLNAIESWYAEYWCHRNGITPTVLTYSIDSYVEQVKLKWPQLTAVKNRYVTTVLICYEHAAANGGCCIYAAGDINLDSDRKEFFCKSLDFVSNIVNPGQHPTSFFMYTPELALSYVNQFDMNLSEQYNKLNFYGLAARPKIDYLPRIAQTQAYINLISNLNYLYRFEDQPWDATHWYGTKEQLMQDLQT